MRPPTPQPNPLLSLATHPIRVCLPLAVLLLWACAGGNRARTPAAAPSAPALNADEEILFSEAKEYIDLGLQNYRDSLWFDAAENFDSALVSLNEIESGDSLSPKVYAAVAAYRDSVLKLQLHAVARTSALGETVPWTAMFDEEMEAVPDSTVEAIDSLTHGIDPRQFDLPLSVPLHPRVLQAMAVFTGPGQGYFSKWLGRKSRYEALLQGKLGEKKMPRDLLYLAMVESGFNPKAWSKSQACGIWQFVSGTARRYGLVDDWWVDPRRDPVKSTDAALAYLGELYAEFGDWYLAMAAYNCGEGRVRKLMAQYPGAGYWDLPLPAETRFYVPKILAAMIIGHNPAKYGITVDHPDPPLAFDTASVQDCLSLKAIAQAAGTTEEQIQDLNPELRRWCSPPNRKHHVLYLPVGSRETFCANYALMDKRSLVSWHRHVVGRGETLASLSSRYGVSAQAIKAANRLTGTRLRRGQALLIPIPADVYASHGEWAEEGEGGDAGRAPPAAGYRVRRGETLYDIARRFGTTVAALREANGLSARSRPKAGQYLRLPRRGEGRSPAGEGTYRIAKGETLYGVARKLGVSVDDLRRWNRVEPSQLKAGQRLRYYRGSRDAGDDVREPPEPESAERHAAPGDDADGDGEGEAGDRPAAKPAQGEQPARYHRVKAGETVRQIAKRHDTTEEAVLRMNGLAASATIFPGDSLMVAPPKEPAGRGKARPAPPASPAPGPRRYYVVKAGDSLWDISIRFRSTVERLKELNGKRLPTPLKPGTRIRVQ